MSAAADMTSHADLPPLSRCPFCGSEPWGLFGPVPRQQVPGYEVPFPVGSCWVECHGELPNLALCGDWVYEGTEAEARTAWNTRASIARERASQEAVSDERIFALWHEHQNIVAFSRALIEAAR